MKKIFILILLFLIIPLASAIEYGDDDFDYDNDDDYDFVDFKANVASDCSNAEEFNKAIFKIDCDGSRSTKYLCKCVRRQAEQNILIKANLNNNRATSDLITEKQIEYTKKFVNVFSQMTIEADVQEGLLGLSKTGEEKIGNCPPALFAGRVKTNTANHFTDQNKLLEEMKEKKERQYKNRCEKLGILNKISKISSKLFNGKTEQELRDTTDCNRRKAELELIEKNLIAGISTKATEDLCHDSASKLSKIAFVKRLEIASKHYEIMGNIEKAKASREKLHLLQNAEAACYMNASSSPVGRATAFLAEFDKEYVKKGGIVPREGQCTSEKILGHREKNGIGNLADINDGEIELCNAMENMNAALADDLRLQYAEKPQSECISFAEFKTFDGMPSEALFDRFANDRSGDLLDAPKEIKSADGEDRYKFLRANPLIAKLSQNAKTKKKLGLMLQKLGRKLKGQSKVDKLNGYLEFMRDEKNGLKSLLGNEKDTNLASAYTCEEMTKNFTAIQVSNDLPPTPPVKTNGDVSFNDDSDKIQRCQIDANNKVSITKLNKTLENSPVFSLAPKNPDEDAQEIRNKYQEFKDQNCPNYAEKIAGCSDKSPVGYEKCRQTYLGRSNFKDQNETMKKNGVPAHHLDWNQIGKSTDEKRHDTKFQNWFNDNIRSKMSTSSVMTKGHEREFISDKAKDQSYASAATIPKGLDTNDTGSEGDQGRSSGISNNVVQQTNEPAVNPGQFIPPFLDNANKTDNVVSADLDDKEEDKPLSKTALEEIVKDSEEELSQTVDPKKKEDLKDAIAQAKSQIKELEDKADRLVQAPFRSPASTNFSTATNSAVGTNNSVSAFSNGGGSRAQISNTQVGNKSQASRNKALLQANGESITIDKTSKLVFSNEPVVSSTDLVVAVSLTPTSDLFADISTNAANLEQYLLNNLTVIPANQTVSIKCQGPACDPKANEIFLHVSKDANNKIVISSVSRNTPIKRVFERDNVLKILKNETKT